MTSSDKWEERASEYITRRNWIVVVEEANPNSYTVNYLEENAAHCLSRAKKANQFGR